MNKKEKSSAVAAVIALAVLIGALCALAKLTALPGGCGKLGDLIDGCMAQSERKISACVDTSNRLMNVFNVSSCVTVDDYLYACGLNFRAASDEECVIKDVHILGASEIEDEEILEYIDEHSDYDVAQVFVAAEYTDGEGAEQNSVIRCYVISDKDSGKILYIGGGNSLF